MKLLYVSNLFLWPRFQEKVKDSLSIEGIEGKIITLYASTTPCILVSIEQNERKRIKERMQKFALVMRLWVEMKVFLFLIYDILVVSRIHGHIESIIKAIINEIQSATQIDISNVYSQHKDLNPSFQKILRSQLEKIVCINESVFALFRKLLFSCVDMYYCLL